MKINKKLVQVCGVCVATLIITCAMSIKAEAKVNDIKISAPSGRIVGVAKGKKVKLKTVVRKHKNKNVKFKSNNPKIAKVSANATVKGIKSGKTKITVSLKSNPKIKTTINVVVYKKAVNKIKLNRNKVSLKKGKRFLLKASIKPSKNVSKVLKYTSSDKSVATVSENGKIKACGTGSTIITVESTDGSNKQAKCMVSVNEPKVSIKKISVRSLNAFNVELSDKCALDYKDFIVTYKFLPNSKTVASNEILGVNTNDNIHYEVVIKDLVKFNSYVKIEICKIKGLNNKEIYIDTHYNQSFFEDDSIDEYLTNMVGHSFYVDIRDYVNCFPLTYPIKINYSNLPKGITVDDYNLKGTCESILNDHIVKVSIEDAKGRKVYINIHMLVGDKDTIVEKTFDFKTLAYKYDERNDGVNMNNTDDYSPSVIIAGGDRKLYYFDLKDYKAVGLPDNTQINSHGGITVVDKTKDVKPGVYNITVSALTPKDKKIIMSYKLTLVEGITIKGRVTDPLGRAFSNIPVMFQIEHNIIEHNGYNKVTTDRNGNYEIRLFYDKYKYDVIIKNNKSANCPLEYLFYSTMNSFTKSQIYDIKVNFYKNN